MSEVVWAYLMVGQVKHAFYGTVGGHTPARCGVGPQWFEPKGWRFDRAGLARLRSCARCLDNLRRDRGVA